MLRLTAAILAVTLLALVATARSFRHHVQDHSTEPLPVDVQNEKVVQHHSLHSPIVSNPWGSKMDNWDFGLSTVVTDDYVRLTPRDSSKEGYLWNDVPCRLKSWTAHIGFRVHGAALGADGFAFWLSQKRPVMGGPMVGYPADGFRGVGVVFDSFDNDGRRDNPAVHVLVNNANEEARSFLGSQDFFDDRQGGCVFDFRNTAKTDLVRATVSYDGQEETLKVKLRHDRNMINCAMVRGVRVGEGYYFGFTAHTGHLADNHDISYFVVTADGQNIEEEIRKASERAMRPPTHEEQFDHSEDRRQRSEASQDRRN